MKNINGLLDKTNINVRDDIFLTSKLLLYQKDIITKKLGLYVVAGKPVHLGHWKVIDKISKENENVILFISTSDRDKISGKDMFEIWLDYLIPILPKNVHCIFSDTPMQELMHLIDFCNSHKNLLYLELITVYADDIDILSLKNNDRLAKDFIKFIGIKRQDTVDISGTLMRQFLDNNVKESFLNYLPPVGLEHKYKIWNKLKNELYENLCDC